MKRLIENTVFSGLVTACRLATVPTSRSPPWVKATTDGVVRPPSELGITVGSPPSRTAMHEFVVPRSIPIVLGMRKLLCLASFLGSTVRNLSLSDADSSAIQARFKGGFAESATGTATAAFTERVHAGRRPFCANLSRGDT